MRARCDDCGKRRQVQAVTVRAWIEQVGSYGWLRWVCAECLAKRRAAQEVVR